MRLNGCFVFVCLSACIHTFECFFFFNIWSFNRYSTYRFIHTSEELWCLFFDFLRFIYIWSSGCLKLLFKVYTFERVYVVFVALQVYTFGSTFESLLFLRLIYLKTFECMFGVHFVCWFTQFYVWIGFWSCLFEVNIYILEWVSVFVWFYVFEWGLIDLIGFNVVWGLCIDLNCIGEVYITCCFKLSIYMAVRQNSGMDRPAVIQTSGSVWITGILVWIGDMDRPVGSGYGSGFYILTRSHIFIWVDYLLNQCLSLRVIWFKAYEKWISIALEGCLAGLFR